MSNDSFTEVTTQSWFSRLGNAIKGVLFGFVLFAASFLLLWWNEGRAVRTAKALTELGGSVLSVSADSVDAANEGKPVHITAEAKTDDKLNDPDFPVSVTAIRLLRKVEMYQWHEREESKSKTKLGGKKETVKTYEYEKGWFEQRQDSDRFKKREGHENPAMRFASRGENADNVQCGGFTLSPGLIGQIDSYEPLPLDQDAVAKLPETDQKLAVLDSGVLYLPTDAKGRKPRPQSPQLGDLKISFQIVQPTTVSFISRQIGSTFEPWQASAAQGMGTSVERLMVGQHSAEAMVGKLEQENTFLTWILRAGGFLAMAFGIGLVMSPMAVLADVLPFLGDLLRMGIGLFAGLVAASLSLATIAAAWLFYRPVLGVGLLVLAAALIVGLKMLGRARRPVTAQPV